MRILRWVLGILLLALLTPIVLVFLWTVHFVYETNNVCGPEDHIIQSEADAIAVAKRKIYQARYGTHNVPGYPDYKPGVVEYDNTPNCCEAKRSRNWWGIIVWEVELEGETNEPQKRRVGARLPLSNCGVVFSDEAFITAEPMR